MATTDVASAGEEMSGHMHREAEQVNRGKMEPDMQRRVEIDHHMERETKGRAAFVSEYVH